MRLFVGRSWSTWNIQMHRNVCRRCRHHIAWSTHQRILDKRVYRRYRCLLLDRAVCKWLSDGWQRCSNKSIIPPEDSVPLPAAPASWRDLHQQQFRSSHGRYYSETACSQRLISITMWMNNINHSKINQEHSFEYKRTTWWKHFLSLASLPLSPFSTVLSTVFIYYNVEIGRTGKNSEWQQTRR